jgi:hypothetical protein
VRTRWGARARARVSDLGRLRSTWPLGHELGRCLQHPAALPPAPGGTPERCPLLIVRPAHAPLPSPLPSPSRYEFIKQNNFAGLSLNLVRRFASQMLQSLKWVPGRRPGALVCNRPPRPRLAPRGAESRRPQPVAGHVGNRPLTTPRRPVPPHARAPQVPAPPQAYPLRPEARERAAAQPAPQRHQGDRLWQQLLRGRARVHLHPVQVGRAGGQGGQAWRDGQRERAGIWCEGRRVHHIARVHPASVHASGQACLLRA